eukprot:NODE_6_length_70510_cov_1.054395.p38 type:complete len:231 gc:universal NODE_6_length_70510_cov_1.054395:51997-51305(-)
MMKNVDKSFGRETFKAGLFFVAKDAKSEKEIFSTTRFSPEYTAFANKLAPIIDLDSYSGFSGGLEEEDKCRIITTAINEIVFHDHQLIQGRGESYLKKHIGNDSIHIVWDEGSIPYMPWTISGDFGDVVIVIRPDRENAFVTLYKRKNIQNFGPLDGTCSIPMEILPQLILITVLSALNRMSSKTWIDSKQEKLFPHKNREACIQYYREKFFTNTRIEDMVLGLNMSSWQ